MIFRFSDYAPDSVPNGEVLEAMIFEEFGGAQLFRLANKRGSATWFADQRLISYKLAEYRKKRFGSRIGCYEAFAKLRIFYSILFSPQHNATVSVLRIVGGKLKISFFSKTHLQHKAL